MTTISYRFSELPLARENAFREGQLRLLRLRQSQVLRNQLLDVFESFSVSSAAIAISFEAADGDKRPCVGPAITVNKTGIKERFSSAG